MQDDLRKVFRSDQTNAGVADIEWPPLVKMSLAMLREAKDQGATTQEASILLSGWWAGMLQHGREQNNG